MSEPLKVNLEPNPTQEAFLLSPALEVALLAPRGEGKTDAGIMNMTYHASLQDKKYRPIPWAIVRDTWKNIERTTYRSLMFPTNEKSFTYQIRSRLHEKDGGRQIWLADRKGNPIWIAFLFGMDTPEDYNQLQSMQLGGFWCEEAAPAMQEEIGKGLPEEAWTIGITSLRHPLMSPKASEWLQSMGGKQTLLKWAPSEIKQGLLLGVLTRQFNGEVIVRDRKAQLTENYPSEDHWSWVRFFEEESPDRALFRIPRGENPHVDVQYRETMERALAGRKDLLERLVIGRPAHVQLGVAVTPEYLETNKGIPWHRSDKNFDPMPNIPVYRFWDGDLHPSCFFAQITPRGKFIGLDTIRAPQTGMGMKQFIDEYVKPLIQNRYHMIKKWRDLGDPSLRDRDPSDSGMTAAGMIESELNTTFEGGVVRWVARREAMKDLLLDMLSDGEPKFTLSKHDKIMHRSLSGGWHYKKNPATGRVGEEPNNHDINSHPAAGLSHGIAKIFKYQREQRIPLPSSKKKIAASSSVQPLYERR